MVNNSGAWAASTSWAPYIRNTILSDHQYAAKFITPANSSAMVKPPCPPRACPTRSRSAVSVARSTMVFKRFIPHLLYTAGLYMDSYIFYRMPVDIYVSPDHAANRNFLVDPSE